MLQQMRNYTKSWAAYLFVLPLAGSFAAWGINDVFKASVPDTVAKVGDSTISKEEFQRQYRLQVRRLSTQLQQPVTPDMARSMNLGSNLLRSIVDTTALNNLATDMGLGVTDAEISRQIHADHAFAGPLGTFDPTKFQRMIGEEGLTEASFLAEAHRILNVQQLSLPVQAAFGVPVGYVVALSASAREERAVEYVVLSPASLGPVAPPPDDALAAYVRAHPERFSTPEYRDVSIAYITPEDVMSGLAPTAEQIKQQYDANSATYNIPEKRNIEQLIFTSEAAANAARAKIDAGQAFEAVAVSLGKKPADISLGSVVQQDLPDARGPAAFALAANGVSAPVKEPFGFVLLHVTAITPGKSTSLEQATPEIRQSLLNQLAGAKIADIMNSAQDALSTGAEIQDAAQRSGMHFIHVTAMDEQGLGPDGKPSAAPNNDALRAEVFKAEIGDIGDPFQAKDGPAFAIKVNGTTPPKLKPLELVRADALSRWSEEQRQKALKAKAESLAADAGAAQDLAPTARSLGVTMQASPALSRTTATDTFSKPLIDAIFAAKPGGVVSGPLGKGNGYVIARITGIRHPVFNPGTRELAVARGEISNQIGDDLALSTAEDAKARQGVTIHQDLVQTVTGEGS